MAHVFFMRLMMPGVCVCQLEAWESSELSKESDIHFKAEDFVHSTPQRLQSLTRYARNFPLCSATLVWS